MNLPRKEAGLAAVAILAAGISIAAHPLSQSASPAPRNGSAPPQISIDSSLVSVLATVRDKKGAIVRNLTKDDFVITEDDHPQTITFFSLGQDLPLTLGLLVDTSRGQSGVLSDERGATRTFLDHSVREDKDQGFLIHFDQQVELLQDLTPSRQKLDSALDLLSSPQLQRRDDNSGQNGGGNSGDSGGNNGGNGGQNGGGYPGGGGGPYGRGGGRRGGGGNFNRPNNQLYDAIYLASNELMKNQNGRKVIVLFTNGIDRGSKESLDDAIEAAQKSNTLIYSVLSSNQEENGGQRPGGFGGGGYGRGGGRGRFPQEERVDPKKILGRISGETGGQMFEASKKLTFDDIYTTISDDLHGEYGLGYPPPATSTASFHPIKVTVKPKDMTVQARTGYYANFNSQPTSGSPPASNAAPAANSSTVASAAH
jgi:VWFA-related protein